MNDRWRALAITLLTALLFVCPRATSGETDSTDAAMVQRRARTQTQRRPRQRRPRVDYTKFSHRTQAHKLNCAQCHAVPTANWPRARAADAFPDVTDYPGHDACVRCHREQFFRGARPAICAVCHTVVSPREGPRFAFQNPNADESRPARRKPDAPSQFWINFPHDIHQDVMARRRDFADGSDASMLRVSFQEQPAQKRIDSCTLCHQTYMPQGDSPDEAMPGRPADVPESLWPKKGTFKTSPTSHASCFNCHWKDGGARPLASDCAACHDLRPPESDAPLVRMIYDADRAAAAKIPDERIEDKLLWRKSSRFRHEIERHEGLGCTSCHMRITAGGGSETEKREVPILSCGGTGTGCHIGAKPKRILNDEMEKKRAEPNFHCAKCHFTFGKLSPPASHDEAVPRPK